MLECVIYLRLFNLVCLVSSTLLLQDEQHLLISKQYTKLRMMCGIPFTSEVLNMGIKSRVWSPRHLLMLYPAYHSTAATAKDNSFSFTGASTFLFSEVQHNPTAHHTRSSSACTACPPSVLPFSYTPNHYYLLWGPKNARRVQHALLASSSAGGALKKKKFSRW
jgi:hypothetical protein